MRRVDANAFVTTCQVAGHANGSLRLFKRFDVSEGRDVYEWAGGLFAPCRRVSLKHDHAPGCDGWDKSGLTHTDRILARCGCPVTITGSRWIWMVTPSDRWARLEDGRKVTNGMQLET